MTLPSRLRYTSRDHATFDAMEATLNVNGSQRIAQLESSVVDPSVLKAEKSTSVKGSHDRRMPGSTSELMLDEDNAQPTTANMDMDFSSEGHIRSGTSPSHRRETSHTFGRVEILRADSQVNEEDDDADARFVRKRRRLANLPVVEKSVYPFQGCAILLVPPSIAFFQHICRANHRLL